MKNVELIYHGPSPPIWGWSYCNGSVEYESPLTKFIKKGIYIERRKKTHAYTQEQAEMYTYLGEYTDTATPA